MARIGITVTKEVAFRDSVQPFSNQYFYSNGTLAGMPSSSQADDIVNELVALEKTFHSPSVAFNYVRLWNYNDIESLSNMILQKPLTGNGSATADASMDKERAFLFRWRAGINSDGAPVYLRKWYHTCGVFPGATSIGTTIHSNATGFSSTQRTNMASYVDAVYELTAGNGPWVLVSKTGRPTDTPNCTAHQYLEHHQLGDQWRGA